MAGKLKAIIQGCCAVLLALTLSLGTGAAVVAIQFPSISPTTAEYDLNDPAEVMTTINWGDAHSIIAVSDDTGNLIPGLGNDYIVLVKHLIILNSYLEHKLTDIGKSVELIVKFDVGAAAFTVTATGTHASISPTTAEYNLDSPADVKTAITWGTATSIISIKDDDGYTLNAGTDYANPPGSANLTIRSSPYLASKLTDIGDKVTLTIDFDVGNNATFAITATGTHASLSPTTADYNIDSPADVTTKVTWGTAAAIVSIVDDSLYTLVPGTHYTVTDIIPGVSANLKILDGPYLAGKLTDIGNKVTLTIDFDVGNNATFAITATGTHARITPQTKDYDLDNPSDMTTVITWGTATSVVSIKDDGGYTLAPGTQYNITDIIPGVSANLTILRGSYLVSKLTDIGHKVVLTIKFNLGASATFTITATGVQPRLSPQAASYDLDSPTSASTTITWGSANQVVSIVDGDHYALVKNTDYTITAIGADKATLTILRDPYLKSKLTDIDDKVVLTADFNVGSDATFTVTAIGIHPTIFPTTAIHDVIDRTDATTTITWGSASAIVSIVDADGRILVEGVDYFVTPISPGTSANLTILSSPYLESKLRSYGKKVVLTIDFDVGADAAFTISVPDLCFIATAAYGTPLAEEIQILRRFRDEYLLTNPLGRFLVSIYYGVSPPMARFITEHPSLKPMVRIGLVPIVAMSAIAVNPTPANKAAILGLLVLVLAALAVWATKQRRRHSGYS
ncbi:MAG: X2-like carbohydrate binding domain-containing protein [Dehalococcoidia bacterium]